MSVENQGLQVATSKSSEKLVEFLERTNLHKKDFAQMIGVTLSYVYSLIDSSIAFSTRTTTLERIAVVMGIEPEDIPEYRSSDEPKLIDEGIQFFKNRQQKLGLSNIDLFRRFSRQKRIDLVDLWRGAEPLPLDWNYLASIAEVLDVSKTEIYPYWEKRMQQYLMLGGLDVISNSGLINAMFGGAKEYLEI